MLIALRTTAKAVERGLNATVKQIPYATMRAVRQTGLDVQEAEREHILKVFTIRQRQFMMRSVKVPQGGWPTKDNPRMIVEVDPQRDHLAKFEEGGQKVSLKGKPYVAVPSRDIRRNKRGLVPRKLYLSAFRPFGRASNIRSIGGRQVQDVGQQRTWFVTLTKGGGAGRKLLMQRRAKGKAGVRALYLFVPSVRIDSRLEFEQVAYRTVRRRWSPNFKRAFAQAVATAR